jgi:hypothetical protein
MGPNDSAECWVVSVSHFRRKKEGGESRSLSLKNELLGVRESERFRVHLELLLPIAKGRCWRAHKDPKSN